jgi:hypothetical protein
MVTRAGREEAEVRRGSSAHDGGVDIAVVTFSAKRRSPSTLSSATDTEDAERKKDGKRVRDAQGRTGQ